MKARGEVVAREEEGVEGKGTEDGAGCQLEGQFCTDERWTADDLKATCEGLEGLEGDKL